MKQSIIKFVFLSLLLGNETKMQSTIKQINAQPNRITYNSMMNLCVKKKDFNGVMNYLELMKIDNIVPDQFSYSIVLNGIKSCKTSKEVFKNTMK